MSNLVEHAQRELELCGQFQEDPRFAQSLLAAVAAFASYGGHSGGSAGVGIQMLSDLLQFKNLSPLTNNPEEWIKHTPDMWDGEHHVWQNRRNGEAFSTDGGWTYRLLSEEGPKRKKGPLHQSLVTHVMRWEPVPDESQAYEAVAQSIDHGEAYGVASASMAEPSDFVGGQTDAVVGYRCTCGEVHRADDPIWQQTGHNEKGN